MAAAAECRAAAPARAADRKSTRLNSSHSQISYAVFCLKKKKICIEEKRLPLHGTGALDSPRSRIGPMSPLVSDVRHRALTSDTVALHASAVHMCSTASS